ncbi:MAG: hypothetical protein IIB38_03435 [Candidatus Hydrogenedentes bacterium]|nr:hypothetical protein [Candidatus Hydrogenedentota bacterium]
MIAPAPTKFNGRDARVAMSRLVENGRTDDHRGGRDAPCDASDVKPSFVLSTLLADVASHEELDLDTLTYHARQSDATAADGYWHASINEARSFLEALVVGMLRRVYVEPEDEYKNTSRGGTPFRCYRRRLMEAGFIDADENDVLQYVYSVASAKGSHHGVTDKAWTGLIRGMVCTTAAYLLARYEAWKSVGMTDPNLGTLDKIGPAARILRAARFGAAAMGAWVARGRKWVLDSRLVTHVLGCFVQRRSPKKKMKLRCGSSVRTTSFQDSVAEVGPMPKAPRVRANSNLALSLSLIRGRYLRSV